MEVWSGKEILTQPLIIVIITFSQKFISSVIKNCWTVQLAGGSFFWLGFKMLQNTSFLNLELFLLFMQNQPALRLKLGSQLISPSLCQTCILMVTNAFTWILGFC